MKKEILYTFVLIIFCNFLGLAQWVNQGAWPNTSVRGQLFGIAVDPDGKVWAGNFSPEKYLPPGASDSITVNLIRVYNPNGTPASFSPVWRIIGNGINDTLTGSNMRGMRRDHQGNILMVFGNQNMYRLNYQTGAGMNKVALNLGTSPTAPAVSEIGHIFVGPTVNAGFPIKEFDSDFNFVGEAVAPFAYSGFSRSMECSDDGNTLYFPSYDQDIIRIYQRPDELTPFDSVGVILGFACESITFNQVTNKLWIAAGSYNDLPAPSSGYTPGTWYEYNLAINSITDSLKWSFNVPLNPNERPRALDFSPDGNIAYIGVFGQISDLVQKVVHSGSSITVLSPNGGENWQVGSSRNITWTSTAITDINIEYTTNNGTNWINIISSTPASSGSYAWIVPNTPATQSKVRISDASNASLNDLSNSVFTISSIPTITVNSPNGGEDWQVGSSHNITWTSVSITNVKLEYSTNNGTNWTNIIVSTPSDGSYTWIVPNTPSTQCKVRVSDLTNSSINDISNNKFAITSIPSNQCPEVPTVNYLGKIYNTVLIADQCWLRENLDVGIMVQGSQNQTNNSIIEKYCYDDDPANCAIYGGFYQWNELMHYVNIEGAQGICPTGWHVPTFAEFSTLSNSAVVSNNSNTLKALGQGAGGGAGTNTSGFSTLLAGGRTNIGSFGNYEYATFFWSSTEFNATNANGMGVGGVDSYVNLNNTDKAAGYSVRCIKDIIIQSLNINFPSGGETWLVGSAQNITWASTGITNIKIEYTTNDGGNWINIIASTPASSGSYSWIVPNTPSTLCKIRLSDESNQSIFSESNSTFIISDSISYWTSQTSGTTSLLQSVYFIDSNVGWAAGFDGTILKTTNGGANWVSKTSGTILHLYGVHFVDQMIGWVVGQNGFIMKSTDGGTSWIQQTSGTGYGFNALHFIDINTGWVVGDYDGNSALILKTTNGGNDWIHQTSGTNLGIRGLHFSDINTGWVVDESGKIIKTNDGGTNWVPQTSGTSNWLNSIHFVDNNIGWAVGSNSTILKTTNGGTSWNIQNSGLTNSFKSVHFIDSNLGWIVGDNGMVLKTNDGGNIWMMQASETSITLMSVNFYNQNLGYTVGYDGTILKYNSPLSITVSSPNGGEDLRAGSLHNLTWTSQDIANVKLEYTTNNGTNWINIIGSVPASTGSYAWTVPNTPSTLCKVRISDASSPSINDISDNIFTIGLSGNIIIISPQAGDTWIGSSKQVVRWDPPIVSGNINIWLSTDGGNSFPTPVSINTINDGVDTVIVPYVQSDSCRILLVAIEDTTIKGMNLGNFSIIPQFTELPTTGIDQAERSCVAWGDYDNDGDLDYLLAGYIRTLGSPSAKLYRNDGSDHFSKQEFISFIGVQYGSIEWGDYDNDGNIDILLTGGTQTSQITKVYRNLGNNQIAEQTDIILPGVSNGSANWVDYDNDGDLDIFIVGQTSNLGVADIYRNDGNNNFTYNFAIGSVNNAEAAWGDYDNDGDLDVIFIGVKTSQISRIFRNDGNDIFTYRDNINLVGVRDGDVKWGDYDNDGDLDLLLSGYDGFYFNTIIYKNNSNNTFEEVTKANIDDANSSSVDWGDYDNDGDLDILLSGWTLNSQFVTKIYRNESNDIFIDMSTIPITGIQSGNAIWGDYDNDGDLDLLVTGENNNAGVSKIYRNNNISSNITPTTPASLNYFVNADSVDLSWNKSTDDETPQSGLTYNLRIGSSPGGSEIISSMADTTGQRKIVAMGNTNLNNSWTIKGLADGTYYWSVQAIDNNFAGSSFSAEKIFTVGPQSISITVPNGSEQWLVGSEQIISWSSNNVLSIKLDYTTDNGSSWIEIVNSLIASVNNFNWSIPNTPSTECKIRISDANNSNVYDISDASFRIVGIPIISLNVPNGGESWAVGSSQSITWVSENIQDIKLEFTTNNGIDWLSIVASISSSAGSYTWLIPDLPSVQCKIRISDVTNPNNFDLSNDVFTIFRIPIITLTEPNGGQIWSANTTHSITWSDNIDENVKIDLHKGGLYSSTITASTLSNGSFSWDIPIGQPIGTDYQIRIASVSDDNLFDYSDNDFTISSVPSISLTYPNGGEVMLPGSLLGITWSSNNVSNVKLEYTTDAGSNWTLIATDVLVSNSPYNIATPNTPSTQCKVRISDAANSTILDESDNVFEIFYYPSEITVTNNVSFGDVSNTLNYKMISIPGNSSISLSSIVTGEHPYDWNAYWDNGAESNYQLQYDGTNTFYFSRGKAFWLLSKTPLNVSTQVPTVTLSVDFTASIPLHLGWNLIANPFEKSTLWSTVQTVNGLAQNQILYFWDGTWSNPTEMKPYEGYYFNNTENRSSLKMPYSLSGVLEKYSLNKMKSEKEYPTDVSGMISLKLTDADNTKTSEIFIGINPGSKDGMDEYDYYSAPGDFEKTKISLVRNELPKRDRYLFIEQRPEIGDGQEFDLEIKAVENQELTITVDGLGKFADKEVYLLDCRLNNLYNLKENESLDLVFAHNINEMKLYIGIQDYIDELKSKLVPLEYGLEQNYPNAFNPSTIIRYSVPVKTNVTLQVYTILGELVQTLIDNVEYNSGRYEISFDGSGLSSGVYIYRLQAGSFIMSKKMMLMK